MSASSILQRILRFGRGDAHARCRVLFVCMGNLCRSPTAEAVFRRQVELAGLKRDIACASAGTQHTFAGYMPDGRARAAALKRGYDMSGFRGRGVMDEDFSRYDLIVAMDRQNLELLRTRCTPEQAERLHLLMDFARRHESQDIPDPYYGNAQAFEIVLDMIEEACAMLLEHVRSSHLARPDTATGR